MLKFTRTEGTPEVISPEAHQAIQTELHRLGKTSARELSDDERQEMRLSLDQSDTE